ATLPRSNWLAQLEPAVAVQLVAVDDRVEDAAQGDPVLRVTLELGPDRLDRERTDGGPDAVLVQPQPDGDVAVLDRSLQHRVQRGLEIVEDLEGEVQPRGDAAEDEVRDLVERLLSRNRQGDLVAGHAPLSAN